MLTKNNLKKGSFFAVWRIRDVYPGSRIRTVSIPDPRSSSMNLSILTPKRAEKRFLSSKKKWSGLFIPDPGSGCWLSPIPDPDPQHCFSAYITFCTFISFFADKKSERSHKRIEIKGFLNFFAWWWEDPDPSSDSRTREAKKERWDPNTAFSD